MSTKLLMTVSAVSVALGAGFIQPASAESYFTWGNSVYGSDGFSAWSFGNSVYGNDGYSAWSSGNSVYGNDGYSSYSFGNMTFGGYGRNRTTCIYYGNMLICN